MNGVPRKSISIPAKGNYKEAQIGKFSKAVRGILPLVSILAAIQVLVPCASFAATAADSAQSLHDQAQALLSQSRYTEAAEAWRQSLTQYGEQSQSDPKLRMVVAAAQLGIGEALRQSGQLDASLSEFAKVLTDYPQRRSQCSDAQLCIGKVYQAKGENVKAVEGYKNVLKRYPERLLRSNFARVRLEVLLSKGLSVPPELQVEIDSARAKHDAAVQEEEQITAARRAAKAKAQAGEVEVAKAELLALFSNPAVQNSHGRLNALGSTQVSIRDKTNARITFNKLLSVAADEFMPEDYRLLRIQVDDALGDYAALIAEATEYLATYPQSARDCEARYYLAVAHDRSGDASAAIAAYDAFVSRYSSSSDPEIRGMTCYALARKASRVAGQGDRSAAIAILERAVQDYADTAVAKSAARTLQTLREGVAH